MKESASKINECVKQEKKKEDAKLEEKDNKKKENPPKRDFIEKLKE